MKAIILAAGKGSRLGAETGGAPKCLLDMGDRKLIDFQVESLIQSGVSDITVVCGYRFESVIEYLKKYRSINIRTVLNHEFESTNTAFSLNLAIKDIKDSFYLLNGDVLFDGEVIRRLHHCHFDNAMAVERKICGDEEVKVLLDNTRINRIGKKIDKNRAYGEFIGAAKFSLRTAQLLSERLDDLICRQSRIQEYFEAGIDTILDQEFIACVDITDIPSIEIDFPEDLQTARERILPKINLETQSTVPKILFYVERNLHLSFLEPVHDYMVENYHVDAAFYSPPHRISTTAMTGTGLDDQEIRRLGMKSRIVDNPVDFGADVAVVSDDTYYGIRSCKKIVNVGHGLISKGFYYKDSTVVKRSDIADLICVPGEWHKNILKKNIVANIKSTGFIKSDQIFNFPEDKIDAFYNKYNLKGYKKIVLYAPTFNEELSSVPCIREAIAEIAGSDTAVLIKLHGMTPQKWVHLYEMLRQKEQHLYLIDDSDIAPAMIVSDVMISDVSSIFVEFMLLDKPVVLFKNPERNTYSFFDPADIEYIASESATEVETVEELKLAVELALLKPGEKSRKRREFARMLGCPYDGRAVQRASEAIMTVHRTPPKPISDDVRFSIIVRWDEQPQKNDVEELVNCIRDKNRGIDYEILFITPFEVKDGSLLSSPEIKICIPEYRNRQGAFQNAVNISSGRYIVLMQPGICLPNRWLKWLYLYFKYDKNTGAVRALSDKDSYQTIIQRVDEKLRPQTLPDIADYLFYHLISNTIETDEINYNNECIMFSKNAYSTAGGDTLCNSGDKDFIQMLGQKLKTAGYKMWHAVEVFLYHNGKKVQKTSACQSSRSVKTVKSEYFDPRRYSEDETDYKGFEEIKMLLEKAKQLKRQEMYNEAIEVLLKAVEQLENRTECVDRDQILYLLKESKNSKINNNYHKSIELLEEAKSKMAI